jgi:hypothetical protein
VCVCVREREREKETGAYCFLFEIFATSDTYITGIGGIDTGKLSQGSD